MQTLSVRDKKGFKKLPSVPGLLSYRKDNDVLYINNGSQWDGLSKKKEVCILFYIVVIVMIASLFFSTQICLRPLSTPF